MKTYIEVKKQYPGVLVLVRIGDFYECFNQDAEVMSKALNITLRTRWMDGETVPMAGVPHHSVECHVAKLIKAGHRVAIIDGGFQ